jgi:hypothetical protein
VLAHTSRQLWSWLTWDVRQIMKHFALIAFVILLSGCVSYYRNYNYDIYHVSDDLSYASVFFWGDHYAPNWEEKAKETARKIFTSEAAHFHLAGEITFDGRPQRFEMGGISVHAFIGRSVSADEATRIKSEINLKSPRERGKARLPAE